MKKFLSFLLAFALVFTLVACGGGDKPSEQAASSGEVSQNADASQESKEAKAESDAAVIKNKRKLVVGVTLFEPLDFLVDGDWTGFDAELAKLFAQELGVKAEFQEIEWASKEIELKSGNVDCLWNGLTYSEERAKQMAMSDPYMKNCQTLVTKLTDNTAYTKIEDLKGRSIAAESGSAGEEYIQNKLKDIGVKYVEKTSQLDALTELVAGTSDTAIIDSVMAKYLINKKGSDFGSLASNDDVLKSDDEVYSVAFRKDSDLVDQLNAFLAKIKKDGTLEKLAEKYSLQEAIIK